MKPDKVKEQLLTLLLAGQQVAVQWDCGNDESMVNTIVDGQEVEADYHEVDDFASGLEDFLTQKLVLPSAGDFSLTGGGTITLEENNIVLNCYSEGELPSEEEQVAMGVPEEYLPSAKGNTDEQEAREWADQYSGRIVLFEQAV